jgi:hypothetical protein
MTTNKLINAQEWLNNKYPDKDSVVKIELEVTDDKTTSNPSTTPSLEGDLEIADYPNLKEIKILHKKASSHKQVSKLWNGVDMGKVTINNCPNLKEIDLKFMKAKEINFRGEFEKLIKATLIGNKLTKLHVDNLTKLRILHMGNNVSNVPPKLKGLDNLKEIR